MFSLKSKSSIKKTEFGVSLFFSSERGVDLKLLLLPLWV